VTLKVRAGLPSLRTLRVVRELEASFRRGCERGGFRLAHYSIQDDHLHAVVEAKGPEALGRGMMSLAGRFARAVNRALSRSGPVLADRYHLRVLRTPREAWRALRYVLLNGRRPRRKAARRQAARGPGRPRPRVVGSLVRRLAAGSTRHGGSARRGASAQLAAPAGLAALGAARSGGRAGLTAACRGKRQSLRRGRLAQNWK
jgi:hypothetical protein